MGAFAVGWGWAALARTFHKMVRSSHGTCFRGLQFELQLKNTQVSTMFATGDVFDARTQLVSGNIGVEWQHLMSSGRGGTASDYHFAQAARADIRRERAHDA